jgi:hypothetical protein
MPIIREPDGYIRPAWGLTEQAARYVEHGIAAALADPMSSAGAFSVRCRIAF